MSRPSPARSSRSGGPPAVLLGLALGCTLPSACAPADEAVDTRVSYADTGRQLALPDVEPEVIAAGLDAAWSRALTLHTSTPWSAAETAWQARTPGCPDLFLGVPEDEDRADEGGQHWLDRCTPADAAHFGGHLWWDTELSATGSAEEAVGRQLSARRSMVGTASVSEWDGSQSILRLAFDGTSEDQWSVITNSTDEGESSRFTWTSQLAGSVSGSLIDSSEAGGRFRTDSYRYVSGPDAPSLELRTEAYLYEPVLVDTFDSLGAELSWVGEGAAGPEDCALEPRGWIGVRTPDATWFDLRFLPLDGEIEPDQCDGCGTLYVRGIEELGGEALGEVCPDWSWAGLEPPDIDEVSWTTRSLEEVTE